tara:strand:- start:22913 stop:23713 length:801 start_codon:yes stop_codon:yes gene_type:complete
MSEKKYIFFVTGLPHSGTSIVQKTIADQEGYFSRFKENKNIKESKKFEKEFKQYKESGKVNINSEVSKMPCEEIYFQGVFDSIKKYLNESNFQVVFTGRDSVEWCLSKLKRKVSFTNLKLNINDLSDKEYSIFDYKLKYNVKEKLKLRGLKSLIIYFKELHDAYEKEVEKIINSNSDARITCINLRNFAKNPEKFLREMGFKNPLVNKSKNNFTKIKNFHEEEKHRHEELRAAQVDSSPSPNLVQSNFDYHPTIIDFVKKTFKNDK